MKKNITSVQQFKYKIIYQGYIESILTIVQARFSLKCSRIRKQSVKFQLSKIKMVASFAEFLLFKISSVNPSRFCHTLPIQFLMYFLNQRTGAIYKQSNQLGKKTFSINWFFIGEDCRLYYHPTYSFIQKILRSCSTPDQATHHFKHLKQKFVDMTRYQILGTRKFTYQGQLPVTNQISIQIREKDTNKCLKLLSIVDEDAECVVHFLKGGVIQMSGANKSLSESWKKLREEEQEEAPNGLIEQLPRLERSLSLLSCGEKSFLEQEKSYTVETVEVEEGNQQQQVIKLNDNQHYVGEVVEGVPHGGGKEVLLVDGLSFSGNFRKGKKHGRGYVTNSSLDTLYCEFVDDQICGI